MLSFLVPQEVEMRGESVCTPKWNYSSIRQLKVEKTSYWYQAERFDFRLCIRCMIGKSIRPNVAFTPNTSKNILCEGSMFQTDITESTTSSRYRSRSIASPHNKQKKSVMSLREWSTYRMWHSLSPYLPSLLTSRKQ